MVRARFRKPVGLRQRQEFLRVQRGGRRFKRQHLLLVIKAREDAQATEDDRAARVGYTVSRKVGNAVARNRVRRRLREVIRTHPEALCEGYDHVVIAFTEAAEANFTELQDELIWLLQKAQVWASRNGS